MHNIVLVGFMGTGKSSVGERLSERLSLDFFELDEIIEEKEGALIKDIFDQKGEPYFRKLEKEAVKEVARRKGVIISAGGGAVIDEENFKNLKNTGVIICLEASPDVILQRTKNLTTRPLLNVADPKKKIEELLKVRFPYYKKSDHCINTDKLTIEQVVEIIINLVTP